MIDVDDYLEDYSIDFHELPGQRGFESFDAQRQRERFLGGDRPSRVDRTGLEPGRQGTSFDERYKEGVRQYESLGGVINAVMVRPDNPKSDVPVVLAPGWSERTSVVRSSAEQLYMAGRTVIVLDHPRRGGIVEPQAEYPADELRKALTIREIVEQEGIPQVDFITHSEGSVNAAIAASLGPDRIRNMVLVNPAGLIGKDTVPRLVGRFAKKNWRNFVDNMWDKNARKAVLRGQREGVKYFAQNPRRAYEEIRAISRSEIEGMLKELHDEGIGIVVVGGAEDPGFPMDRMQHIVKSEAHRDGFVDGFLSVKGGHDELYLHPELYTGAAEKMLTALENKQVSKSFRSSRP